MAVQDNTNRNLNDLMAAAHKKLDTQQQEQAEPIGDIYASFRDESEAGEQVYPDTEILYSPQGMPQAPQIKNTPSQSDYEQEIYVDNNDTPVFTGGPGMSQVDLWKKQFSKESVFHVKILDKHFIFRTLNRFEYKQIVAIENVDALYREEMICRTCVLFPYNYDFKTMAMEDSGYPSTLAEIIMENSGFTKEYGIEVL